MLRENQNRCTFKLKQLKAQLDAIKRKHSLMFRFRHQRDKFLKNLIDQWNKAANPEPATTKVCLLLLPSPSG